MTSNHHALYDLGYTRTTMALNLSLIHIFLSQDQTLYK